MNVAKGTPQRRPYRMQARQDAVASSRERILRAAYDQWAERDYDQVSLQSIAEAAGVSRQTVSRQFGTKDELAFAVVDWQKPREDAFRVSEPGDVEAAILHLLDRYEEMGDANVRVLQLEGRVPAIDHLLEISRTGHREWIERTLLPEPDPGPWPHQDPSPRSELVLALYAATDVTLWKLLRRDLKQSRATTRSTILRLVRALVDEPPPKK